MSNAEPETLTVAEAAAYLRVDPVTIQRELRRGRLPGNQVGKSWRLSREALRDYVTGGDPTVAMLTAKYWFSHGEFDPGLKEILKNCIAAKSFPPEHRAELLKRLGTLAEAEARGDASLASSAKYAADIPALIEHRSSPTGMSRATFNVMGLWNDTVDAFASALRDRARKERLRKRSKE